MLECNDIVRHKVFRGLFRVTKSETTKDSAVVVVEQLGKAKTLHVFKSNLIKLKHREGVKYHDNN